MNPAVNPDNLKPLIAELAELADAIEYIIVANVSESFLGQYLGQLTLKILEIGSLIGPEIFVLALAKKYPAGFCGYWGSNPCSCQRGGAGEKMPPGYPDYSKEQLEWGIHRWWEHLSNLYRTGNIRSGGQFFVLRRLLEEIQELKEALENTSLPCDAQDQEPDAAYELADVLAWTIGLSDLADIVLEQELGDLLPFADMA